MKNKEAIALYLRLSLADGDLGKSGKDESNSIENQRLLLMDYIESHPELSGEIVEYIDDGYTGTNFDRPGFRQMLEDARKGKVQTILVKDLSRLGRNFVGVGDYVEQIFPVLGIRFIAVNNNYDGGCGAYGGAEAGMEIAITSLINSLYSKDISRKIRSAREVKWKQGYATAASVPFGYLWNPGTETKWEVDPVASKYVRRIFALALNGMNTSQICMQLNEDMVPVPSIYKKKSGVCFAHLPEIRVPDTEQLWTSSKVWRILQKYEYTGALVMGKRKKLTIGNRKSVAVPESEQIITENHHAAIVTHEEFELAQMVIRKSTATGRKEAYDYPLKGKLACGNCRRQLVYNELAGGAVLYCSHKRQAGKYSKCCGDNYSEAMVNARVGYAIRQMLRLVGHLEESARKSITIETPEIDLEMRKVKILKAERIRLYEAYADGIISREEYLKKKQELSDRIAGIQAAMDKAESALEEDTAYLENLQSVTEQGEKLSEKGKLTKQMVDAFIEQVYVYSTNEVEVVFQCEDVLKDAIKTAQNWYRDNVTE